MLKLVFVFLSSFFLFSCSLKGQNTEYFYLPKEYKGYIVILHENYKNTDANNKRIFKIDSTGLVLTTLPFKNSDGFYNMKVFRYKNNHLDDIHLKSIELGSQLQLCDSCSDTSQFFEGDRFFYLKGVNFHNNLLGIDCLYTIYLVTNKKSLKGKSENDIYAIVYKLENYFFNYDSKIPPFENKKVHNDLKEIIFKENQNIK